MMGWSTGRKTPFLSALLTSMVASVISAAAQEYILFVILRILLGENLLGDCRGFKCKDGGFEKEISMVELGGYLAIHQSIIYHSVLKLGLMIISTNKC